MSGNTLLGIKANRDHRRMSAVKLLHKNLVCKSSLRA